MRCTVTTKRGSISTRLAVFHGILPSRALGMVIEWASMHQDELRQNWELMGEQQKPKKISPLK